MKKKEAFKHHPKMSLWKKVVLGLPVLLSMSWIFYLQAAPADYGGELLAPVNPAPLIAALVIFTIGYVIFLFLMFSENIQDFLWRRIGH